MTYSQAARASSAFGILDNNKGGRVGKSRANTSDRALPGLRSAALGDKDPSDRALGDKSGRTFPAVGDPLSPGLVQNGTSL